MRRPSHRQWGSPVDPRWRRQRAENNVCLFTFYNNRHNIVVTHSWQFTWPDISARDVSQCLRAPEACLGGHHGPDEEKKEAGWGHGRWSYLEQGEFCDILWWFSMFNDNLLPAQAADAGCWSQSPLPACRQQWQRGQHDPRTRANTEVRSRVKRFSCNDLQESFYWNL